MTRPSHAALVEEVAKKFLAANGFEFAGDDIFESDNPRAIVAVAFAHDIVATFAARLSDVTPEMVEAYERNYDNSIGEAENVCVSDWRAMLAASCLGETKP